MDDSPSSEAAAVLARLDWIFEEVTRFFDAVSVSFLILAPSISLIQMNPSPLSPTPPLYGKLAEAWYRSCCPSSPSAPAVALRLVALAWGWKLAGAEDDVEIMRWVVGGGSELRCGGLGRCWGCVGLRFVRSVEPQVEPVNRAGP